MQWDWNKFVVWPKPPSLDVKDLRGLEQYDQYTLRVITRAWNETFPKLRYVDHTALKSIVESVSGV